jgi:integrase/recombinase XerD
MKRPQLSIYHDTRRQKLRGTYPVKVRVYDPVRKRTKYYPTGIDLSTEEFEKAFNNTKPKTHLKKIRFQVDGLMVDLQDVLDTLDPFTFTNFENKVRGLSNKGDDGLTQYYIQKITQLKKEGRIGTAANYEQSLKSLQKFEGRTTLKLGLITEQWLAKYERHMLESKTKTTVGIYLRPLRAMINEAIKSGALREGDSPFGKDKYKIPNVVGRKKALDIDQVKRLYRSVPGNHHQQFAKDFWILSYVCNGMNPMDLAHLKWSDIDGDYIRFKRRKTALSSGVSRDVSVYMNDVAKDIIGRHSTSEQPYVLDVLSDMDNPTKSRNKVQNFTRKINQHLKLLAKELGLPESISIQWARHSFATITIRKGAPLEYVSEALSHTNLKTTQNYFAGFDQDEKKRWGEKLTEFDDL